MPGCLVDVQMWTEGDSLASVSSEEAEGPARSAELTTKPSAEAMGLCLSVFDYLNQISLAMRTFRIGCLPFSEQTPSAPNIECELPRGRKTGGLRNMDEEVSSGLESGRNHSNDTS